MNLQSPGKLIVKVRPVEYVCMDHTADGINEATLGAALCSHDEIDLTLT